MRNKPKTGRHFGESVHQWFGKKKSDKEQNQNKTITTTIIITIKITTTTTKQQREKKPSHEGFPSDGSRILN